MTIFIIYAVILTIIFICFTIVQIRRDLHKNSKTAASIIDEYAVDPTDDINSAAIVEEDEDNNILINGVVQGCSHATHAVTNEYRSIHHTGVNTNNRRDLTNIDWSKYIFCTTGCWVKDGDGLFHFVHKKNFTEDIWNEWRLLALRDLLLHTEEKH